MIDDKHTGEKEKQPPGKLKKGINALTGVNELPPGKGKKAIYYLTGISDIYFIIASIKQTFGLMSQRASFVKKRIRNLEGPPVESEANQSFDDVIKRGNKTTEELLLTVSRQKKYWLSCFFFLILIILFLTSGYARLIINGAAGISYLRATLTLGVLFSAGMFTFIKALACEFAGWQLVNKAHSESECGTLRYFLNDNGVRRTFNILVAGQKRGGQ